VKFRSYKRILIPNKKAIVISDESITNLSGWPFLELQFLLSFSIIYLFIYEANSWGTV
jgi:hypothetical protein